MVSIKIKALCPTRWTARTEALSALLSDYSILMETLDEIHQTTRDEYGYKAAGLLSALEKFSTLFGLKLSHLVFGASETLSITLQGKDTTLQEALSAVNLTKAFYKRQRTDEAFHRFFADVVRMAREVNIGDPQLSRHRRVPRRLDEGSQPHRYDSPEDYHRHLYYQACDLLQQELEDRFDQQLLQPVLSLENVLLKAANGEELKDELQSVKSSCYKDDFDFDQLQKQLHFCADVIKQALPGVKRVTSVHTICEAMKSQDVYKSMFSELHKVLRLYLTIPITSATAERTFSTLKRILTFS